MPSQTNHPPLRSQAPWVVVCRIIGILATFAGNILAARLLGPAEFGLYLFLSSVAAFGSLLGSAGLSEAALRFSSENLTLGRRALAVAYVRRIARLCVVSTLLAAGLTAIGLFAFHLATGRLTETTLLVVVTLITLVALSWQHVAGETLRGWNNLKLASLFSGGIAGGPISNLLFVAGITGLLLTHVAVSAVGAIGLMAASVCLTVPWAVWSVWRMTHRAPARSAEPPHALSAVEDRQLRGMVVTVIVLHSLAYVGLQLDIWIGGALLRPDEFGVYGVAKRTMLLTAIPVQMAMLTVVAAIPRLHTQGRRRELQDLMRCSAGMAAVPSLAAMLLLVLFPEPILQFLFGGSYGGAAPMIRILAVGHLALVVAGNPINVLTLTGRHRMALPANLTCTTIMAIGGPLAALKFGVTGLAWVSATALVAQNALLWILVRHQVGIWTHIGLPRRQYLDGLWVGSRVVTRALARSARLKNVRSTSSPPIAQPVVSGQSESL